MEEAQKKNLFKYGGVLIIILAIFVGVKTLEALKVYSYIGRGTPAVNVISVSGKGEVMAKPDIANFTFSVAEDGKTAKEAQDKATIKINKSLDLIKSAGVAEKDIKTISYNLMPKYEYSDIVCVRYPCPSKQTIVGYTITQSVEVKVRKIDDTSSLLTKIAEVGASDISGISFVIDNEETLQAEAKEKAITDAKEKARILAKQLGVSLGRIVSFSDNQGQIYYAKAYAMDTVSMEGSVGTPQVPSGENTINSNVSITYEIK